MLIILKKLRLTVTIFGLGWATASCAGPNRADDWKLIEEAWPKLVQHMEDFSRVQANRSNQHLYYLQLWTYDLMMAAISERKTTIRNDLFKLYHRALNDLKNVTRYKYFYDPRSNYRRTSMRRLPETKRMWLDKNEVETVLNSSQFLFLVSATARSLLQSGQLDKEAVLFINRAIPVVEEHLLRWTRDDRIFQVTGWGCGRGLYNHREFLLMKLRRKFTSRKKLSYCNMVTDNDLWIIAIAANVLAIQGGADRAQRLDKEDRDYLLNYLRESSALLRERTKPRSFKRLDGSEVQGLVFDPGAWDDHPDNRFSLHSSGACPSAFDEGSEGVGWDVSHGTRQPVIFTLLFETRSVSGVSWPDEEVLGGFARAFAHGVFEGNLERPRLRNYLDGSNGWYRVDVKSCTGYRPFGMSHALIFGAWGRYAPFYGKVGEIVQAAHRILTSTDPDDVRFRSEVWDKARYVNGKLRASRTAKARVSVYSLPLLSTYAIGLRHNITTGGDRTTGVK